MKFGLAITFVLACVMAWSTSLSAQQDDYSRRGMQTARPQNDMSNHSPRTIDFTNPQGGTPVQTGNRQIPLQNLPFQQRRGGNFEDLWDKATDGAQNANQKARNAGQKFWDKVSKPFKRNGNGSGFQLPGNLNRKPNYNNGDGVLINPKGNGFQMPNLFKPMKLEQPQWMRDMNQRTKEMFSRNKPAVRDGIWTDPMSITGNTWKDRSNQAWQKFSHNINPQNWKMPGSQSKDVNPPLRQANNWMDGSQTRRR